MVHAKNYETVSTLAKVMQKKLWPLFSRHGVDQFLFLSLSAYITCCYVVNTNVSVKIVTVVLFIGRNESHSTSKLSVSLVSTCFTS